MSFCPVFSLPQMPVANGTLLHKKKGAAIILLFLHDYSPYSMKKRNSPAEEDDFTMLTRSLSRRRDALPQKSSPSHRRMEKAPLRSHKPSRRAAFFPHPCPIQRPSALTPSAEMEKPPIPWNEGLNRSQYSRTISHAKRRACYSRRGRTRPDQREWGIQRPESPRP